RAAELRTLFGMTALPFTDHLLEDEYRRLSGPGHAVMRSLSSAIREELASVKDMLDLIERGNLQQESLGLLHALLSKLSKTLGMVGLTSAANALNVQLPTDNDWVRGAPPDHLSLNQLAEAVLYVESMVANLELGETPASREPANDAGEDINSFAGHQLNEARVVVVDEAQAGLAMAKR